MKKNILWMPLMALVLMGDADAGPKKFCKAPFVNLFLSDEVKPNEADGLPKYAVRNLDDQENNPPVMGGQGHVWKPIADPESNTLGALVYHVRALQQLEAEKPVLVDMVNQGPAEENTYQKLHVAMHVVEIQRLKKEEHKEEEVRKTKKAPRD
jgi:hypothetical protein